MRNFSPGYLAPSAAGTTLPRSGAWLAFSVSHGPGSSITIWCRGLPFSDGRGDRKGALSGIAMGGWAAIRQYLHEDDANTTVATRMAPTQTTPIAPVRRLSFRRKPPISPKKSAINIAAKSPATKNCEALTLMTQPEAKHRNPRHCLRFPGVLGKLPSSGSILGPLRVAHTASFGASLGPGCSANNLVPGPRSS